MSRWLFTPLLLSILACTGGSPPDRPHILLVLVDALRKDHLALYGYERATSPALDRLAERGWIFESHIAHATQTVPSTLSMLMSVYPVEHGFVHRANLQFFNDPPLYPQEFLFLSEVLKEAGYTTAAWVTNPFLAEKNGFDQGYDHFVRWRGLGEPMTEAVREWLRAHVAERESPFYAYVHYMDVHSPYTPPPAYAHLFPHPPGKLIRANGLVDDVDPDDLAFTVAMYDGTIRYVDTLIGRLLQTLEELGVADDTIVVITSDHGDEFLEHGGRGHGTTVYGELVRVPLLVVYPRELEGGKRVRHLTRHLDLAPTLLDLVGLDTPASFKGGSLFEPAESAFAEDGPWRVVYADGWNLVVNTADGRTELYAADDELDQKPLDDPETLARMRTRIDRYLELERAAANAGRERGQGPAWTDEEVERLRALGYAD